MINAPTGRSPGPSPVASGSPTVKPTGSGRNALISGDSLRHPVQLAHSGMGGVGDVDPAEARTTRQRLLTGPAGTDDLLPGTHFARPTGGRVQRQGNRFQLVTEPPALLSPASFRAR